MNDAELEAQWHKTAKQMLRAHMANCGKTYAGLAADLAAWGISENEANLRNKVSRGAFSAAFFLQCLVAMGCDAVRLEDEKFPAPEGYRKGGG